jgi:predicted transcriptional regulator
MKSNKGVIIAKDIMSSPLYYIKDNQTVQEALNEMKKNDLKRIAVLNIEGALIGTTDSWRLKLSELNEKIYKAISAKPHIITSASVIPWDTPIDDIFPLLVDKDIVIVKDDKGEKVGVISRNDLSKSKKLV